MTQPWLQPRAVQIYLGWKIPSLGILLLLHRLNLCIPGNSSFRPQEPGQCLFWKFGFYHGRMLRFKSAATEIAFEAMWAFFLVLLTNRNTEGIFSNVFLFFIFNSNNINCLLLSEEKGIIRGATLHYPLPQCYSMGFFPPHFILGGENNSPVLAHLIRNQ